MNCEVYAFRTEFVNGAGIASVAIESSRHEMCAPVLLHVERSDMSILRGAGELLVWQFEEMGNDANKSSRWHHALREKDEACFAVTRKNRARSAKNTTF